MQCIGDHIRPWLDGWHDNGSKPGNGKARCPSCGRRSLTVEPGSRGARIYFRCWGTGGCDWLEVRAAMVRGGVPDGCLPVRRTQRTEDELAATLTAILEGDGDPAERLVVIAVVLWNGGMLPRGAALEALARRARLSPATAYRVTASSHGESKRDGCVRASNSHPESPTLTMRAEREGLTREFAVNLTQGVNNSVDGLTPSPAPRRVRASIRECVVCGRDLGPDARYGRSYCSRSCQAKAYRARVKERRQAARSRADKHPLADNEGRITIGGNVVPIRAGRPHGRWSAGSPHARVAAAGTHRERDQPGRSGDGRPPDD